MKLAIIFIILFVLSSFAIAVPPFQESSGTDTLELRIPLAEYVPITTPVYLHTHVYNSTSGLIVTNETTDCLIHLYNHSGKHILEEWMGWDSNGMEFKFDINNSIFIETGQHSYILQCNNTGGIGGFVSGSFQVTETGLVDVTTSDTTAGLSVLVFILFATSLLLVLPFVTNFSKNQITDLIIKRACWVIGIYLMMFNASIIATIAKSANLGLNQELFRYMWLFGMAGYVLMAYMVLKTLFDVMKLWDIRKKEKRMGNQE